ncbi:methyl-accepting chemotaxis protein [uncultured Psychrosphaera sp.]|uniref:HAMP domain-containing methyl-accepting chemotaxis protein n=1 Tax=uncultured Psychrosphaera sp. TaxID=1403522 RepID=UPI002610067B|nr:methyl-accepting chemotaxis protein [uncultured Psychrosphaera sp.]
MNLTIAKRVIGGFAITSTLLLFLGINSIFVLNGISESTTQVNQVSVPALDASAKLQQNFLQMSKTALLEYYATDFQIIEESIAKFNEQSSEFDTDFALLTEIVSQDELLFEALPSVKNSYDAFKEKADLLSHSKERVLKLADAIATTFDDTEMAADDASVYLLDFIDLNNLSVTKPAARELAVKIESSMVSVISAVTDIKKENKKLTVAVIIKELAYTQDSINESLAQLITVVGNSDVEGFDDVVEQIGILNDMLTNEVSIQKLKVDWINQLETTDRLLTETNLEISNGLAALDSLSKVVKEQLSIMKTELSEDVSDGVLSNWFVMVISIILSVFIAFITVIRVTRPLAEVNRVLTIVSTGDLTTKLDDSGTDEFGILAKNCNLLIENLRNLINGIVNRSNQLATAAEETSMIVKESTIAINDQRSQVEQAATATSEMASTSESVMERANEALSDIKHADEDAEKVKLISNTNKDTILQLAKEIEQASGVINDVNQHSVAIGGILDVIRGVADQTNLLALNAAIEAARAGEHGRGFAVVADEVRTLASKTQQSTEEIQSMIEQLQSGSTSAVEVMNNSKEQAEKCVEQSEQATIALDSITDSVHQANDMSEQIVSAAREQNQVSSEISERLESIVTIAEQTALGAEQTELSSQEVAKLAEELRQSVDQFRL